MDENNDKSILASVNHDTSDDVSRIVALTIQSMRPAWKDRPGGDRRFDLFDRDGDRIETIVPPRKYGAISVDGLISQIADLASVENDDRSVDQCRVFLGRGAVTALLNERGDRNDRIHMQLDVCKSMRTIEKGVDELNQRDFDWLLRSQFEGRFSPETLLPSVRKLKWINSRAGKSEVSHGNETVDLSIKAELEGLDGGFPEQITVETSVFEQLACLPVPPLFKIRCAVKINVQERVFSVEALEGEVAKAYGAALEYIKNRIEIADLGENVKVFQDSAC